jgi:hypothetical protein
MIRKEIAALRKSPYLITPPWTFQQQEGEVRLADDGRNQRVDDIGNQGVDDRPECDADDDGYGKIDHIAAQDKVAKSFNH